MPPLSADLGPEGAETSRTREISRGGIIRGLMTGSAWVDLGRFRGVPFSRLRGKGEVGAVL